MELFVAVLASLFSVVNPLGAVPVFLAMTPDYDKAERSRTAFQTSLYVIVILISFFLGGAYILSFFGISLNAMRIAGGMVILSSGYALLNGKFAESRAINKQVKAEALVKEDISFAPMAMPMLSGPGSISLLISLNAANPAWQDQLLITGVIIVTGIIIYFILNLSPLLFRVLGVAGLKAISRIMGFIVMAIGIQYTITGVVALVKALW
ncbi:MAG: MarC family protein [Saprospiraceae bacterium]